MRRERKSESKEMASAALLSRQFKAMQSDKDIPGISCGLVDNNVFEWEVMLMISDDVKYYGGEVESFASPPFLTPYPPLLPFSFAMFVIAFI